MKLFYFLKYLMVDPVNLGFKTKILSLLACFIAIFFIALITKIVSPWETHPMIVASMGASAIILFFIPASPLAQPWPFVGGQLISAVIGVFCALNIEETSTAAATAVGAAIFAMLLLRCLHPPAAATSLTPIMAGTSITSLGYSFVLVPVAVNVFSMLFLAIIINRWVMGRDYPSPLPIKKRASQRHTLSKPAHYIGFSEQDLNVALKESDVFIDMTHADLSKLLSTVEQHAFKRLQGHILCQDIMVSDVTTVEFGTELEDAWKIMCHKKLKAMPVLDKTQRVIGMVTWNDFFKGMNLTAYDSFQDRFRQFIQRGHDVTAVKPEAVGLIMATDITTVFENEHIVHLISLMSVRGHRQIPVVNLESRLVGMIYQSNLIAALYNDKLGQNKEH